MVTRLVAGEKGLGLHGQAPQREDSDGPGAWEHGRISRRDGGVVGGVSWPLLLSFQYHHLPPPGLSPAVAHVLVHPRHPFSFRHTLFTFGRCVSQPVICSTPPTRPLLFTTDEPDPAYAFFGEHYGALSAIKARYDPTDLFIVVEGVGSERWATQLTCRV